MSLVQRVLLGSVVLGALLACKKKAPEPQPVVEVAPVAAAPAPTAEEVIESFAGSYITNYGKAKCTQVKKNVNCLYQGKSGSLDCKVTGDKEMTCDWDDSEGSGKAKLKKQPDGKLAGTWGWQSSDKNGGAWSFKPTDP